MAKRKKTKWNKVHFFKKKSTNNKVGHPVLVYRQNKNNYRYLTFTHTPEDDKVDNYKQLKHNIDPLELDRDSYVNIYARTTNKKHFKSSDKKYRIHEEDKNLINRYKK